MNNSKPLEHVSRGFLMYLNVFYIKEEGATPPRSRASFVPIYLVSENFLTLAGVGVVAWIADLIPPDCDNLIFSRSKIDIVSRWNFHVGLGSPVDEGMNQYPCGVDHNIWITPNTDSEPFVTDGDLLLDREVNQRKISIDHTITI